MNILDAYTGASQASLVLPAAPQIAAAAAAAAKARPASKAAVTAIVFIPAAANRCAAHGQLHDRFGSTVDVTTWGG